MIKLLVIPVAAPPFVAEVEPSLDLLSYLVGGWLQAMPVGETAHMYMDEEGKMKQLTPNRVATSLLFEPPFRDIVAGPAIVASSTEDGDEADVPEEVVERVKALWTG